MASSGSGTAPAFFSFLADEIARFVPQELYVVRSWSPCAGRQDDYALYRSWKRVIDHIRHRFDHGYDTMRVLHRDDNAILKDDEYTTPDVNAVLFAVKLRGDEELEVWCSSSSSGLACVDDEIIVRRVSVTGD